MRTIASRLSLFLVLVLLAGCASTAVGKAVQSAEGAKIAVESAADEVIRLHERCTDGRLAMNVKPTDAKPCVRQLGDADYAKAKAAYDTWDKAEKVYLEALIAWQKTKNAPNDARVQAALTQLGPALEAASDMLCSFKAKDSTLAGLCARIGR